MKDEVANHEVTNHVGRGVKLIILYTLRPKLIQQNFRGKIDH